MLMTRPCGAADLVGEDLHVAGQDDGFHLFGGDPGRTGARLGLRILRDGNVLGADAVELGDGCQVRVVADDRDHVDGWVPSAGGTGEVGQALALRATPR